MKKTKTTRRQLLRGAAATTVVFPTLAASFGQGGQLPSEKSPVFMLPSHLHRADQARVIRDDIEAILPFRWMNDGTLGMLLDDDRNHPMKREG